MISIQTWGAYWTVLVVKESIQENVLHCIKVSSNFTLWWSEDNVNRLAKKRMEWLSSGLKGRISGICMSRIVHLGVQKYVWKSEGYPLYWQKFQFRAFKSLCVSVDMQMSTYLCCWVQAFTYHSTWRGQRKSLDIWTSPLIDHCAV